MNNTMNLNTHSNIYMLEPPGDRRHVSENELNFHLNMCNMTSTIPEYKIYFFRDNM